MNSKQKGSVGEREAAELLRSHGFSCRRTQQYAGFTGDASDLTTELPFHFEVKRVEALNIDKAMSQAIRDSAEKLPPVVLHRKNRKDWLVTMRFEDWICHVSKKS